jgi:hypothetical protein
VGWTTANTFSISSFDQVSYCLFHNAVGAQSPETREPMRVWVRLYNSTQNEYYPDSDGFRSFIYQQQVDAGEFIRPYTDYPILVNKDISGDTIEAQAQSAEDNFTVKFGTTVQAAGAHDHQIDVSDHTHEFDWLHDHDVDVPDHVHDPQPGIYETGDTPSNVDVAINGSTVATNIGTGTFETTIDVGGEFTTDAWNTVEVSSDSLGIIEVSAAIDGYDQIGVN